MKKIQTFLPILKWLPNYNFATLTQDLLAGLTVGMVEVPQGIAYAAIAGLPPQYGLYSGLLDGFIYALLGGCKDLNIGPSSLLSLIVRPPISKFGAAAAPLITFFSGIVILILGILNLGFVVNFFSYPVIAGFICGGCLQIGFSQLKTMFGISGPSDNTFQSWQSLITNFDQFRPWDAILGISGILFLIILKEMNRFGSKNVLGKCIFFISISRSALVLIIGTVISYLMEEKSLFQITGTVTGGLPSFQPPSFEIFPSVASTSPISISFIPLLSILEATTVAKVFNKGIRLDVTQEMLALGLCNTLGSFVNSMPVTGSFSRSAVNNASGVRTTLAGVFTSILLLFVITFLTETFYYVPKATLAAILIATIIYLFDFRAWVLFWKTKKSDYIPFLATFVSSIFLSLDYSLLIGAGVNLLFILYANVRPKFDIIEENHDGHLYVITPKDTVYYPAAEFLRDKVMECEGYNATVIINGKYICNMDITVAKTIVAVTRDIILKNYKIFLINFKDNVKNTCLGVDKHLKEYFLTEEQYQSSIKSQQDFVVIDD